MKKISDKQQNILDFINSFSMEHGYPPSVREICAEVGLRSTSTVHAHLKKLQEAGYLEASDHKSRALAPVSGASMVPRVPILGRVTAGMPILAVEERDGDIVIALLEDEATCKTLCLTPDGVWLRPENPAYPLIDGTGCQILGVVKAVYREY